ncbi:PAS domain-containing protein [Flavobacterium sp. P21]|uniref:PAS domain-containing protein n=1 Tax=Flavobacterium sp. P21 TaxID=3423948 RepID=UPI003D6675EA
MNNTNYDFLSNGGEMGALTRAKDWSKTSVGAVETWSQSLRATLGILLHSKFPMFLFWGPDHICFYNDAYRPSLGNEGKHPDILGQKGAEYWPEIWDFIGPLIDQVLTNGEPTWHEDQLVPIYRNGRLEDVYWTFSYSPVVNDDGKISGVLVVCTETTEKVNIRKN